tara:strand:- start:932 stop:1831 length:900 start_codon:yes stop_codon:yes gene_type:complete
MKISIIITSFNEPRLKNCIGSIIKQTIKNNFEIVVVAPDKEAEKLVKHYSKIHKKIAYFKDPGKGKSNALNLLFKNFKFLGDILIFTDGDVTLDKNAITEIKSSFKNPSVGCITGRVISSNPKNTKLGYWSHLLADAGAHKIRKELSRKNKFLECSGYLFAFRNNIIKKIPTDVAEDTYIPYIFYQKGYKIKYAENAKVYVKNPENFSDWLKQRTRTAKAHETLHKYINTKEIPRVKSFSNEVKKGFFTIFTYPRSAKEFCWTLQLYFARLYMWIKVFSETKLMKKHYKDNWERVESTK